MMENKKKKNQKRIFDWPLLARIFAFAKPYAGKFYLSIVLALLLALVSPLRPLMINLTLKRVNASAATGSQMVLDFLLWISLLQVGLLLAETAMRFFFSYTTSWLGHRVVKDMRVKVYEKVLSYNLKQYDKTPIGTLTTRTINDIESINDIFSEGLVPIVQIFFLLLPFFLPCSIPIGN